MSIVERPTPPFPINEDEDKDKDKEKGKEDDKDQGDRRRDLEPVRWVERDPGLVMALGQKTGAGEKVPGGGDKKPAGQKAGGLGMLDGAVLLADARPGAGAGAGGDKTDKPGDKPAQPGAGADKQAVTPGDRALEQIRELVKAGNYPELKSTLEKIVPQMNMLIRDYNKQVEKDNAKIQEENAKLPKDKQKPLVPEIALIDEKLIKQEFDMADLTVALGKKQAELKKAEDGNQKDAVQKLKAEEKELQGKIDAIKKDIKGDGLEMFKAFNLSSEAVKFTLEGSKYNPGLMRVLAWYGRSLPLESFPYELPRGIKGAAIGNQELRKMIDDGELTLKIKSVDPRGKELPSAADIETLDKAIYYAGTLAKDKQRYELEQLYHMTRQELTKLDPKNELKWMPEKIDAVSDDELKKTMHAAGQWIELGLQLQYYAEQTHRLHRATTDTFQWGQVPLLQPVPKQIFPDELLRDPRFKDVLKVTENKDGSTSIKVVLPTTLDRNDPNIATMDTIALAVKEMKPAVDQIMREIGKSEKNADYILFDGDIKLDPEGRIGADGKFYIPRPVPPKCKCEQKDQDFEVKNGDQTLKGKKGDWEVELPNGTKQIFKDENFKKGFVQRGKPEEYIPIPPGGLDNVVFEDDQRAKDDPEVNAIKCRMESQKIKYKGEDMIEVTELMTYEYRQFLSYHGHGWVTERQVLGKSKANQQDKDFEIKDGDKTLKGKKGDWIVEEMDGTKKVFNADDFDRNFKSTGTAGEYIGRRLYKMTDWVLVNRTDSGSPNPSLMKAPDIPDYINGQTRWRNGSLLANLAVDGLMLYCGITEIRAAYAAASAARAALPAAERTFLKTALCSLAYREGVRGVFHATIGGMGFMRQGFENSGWIGKKAMVARDAAMMLDLGAVAIGRQGGLIGMTEGSKVMETAVNAWSKSSNWFNWAWGTSSKIAEAKWFQWGEAVAMNSFFIGEFGFKQFPHLVDKVSGTDTGADLREAWVRSRGQGQKLEGDRKLPSGFDKQTLLRVDAFVASTEKVLGLPENSPERQAHIKKLIETFSDEKAHGGDRTGAAVCLVRMFQKRDGSLPESIVAGDKTAKAADLGKFIEGQRLAIAGKILDGYATNLSANVTDAALGKRLEEMRALAKDAVSGADDKQKAAIDALVKTYQDKAKTPEERVFAAQVLLTARKMDKEGKLSEFLGSEPGKDTSARVKAADVIAYLKTQSGWKADGKENAGHIRLAAGDTLLRLDLDDFSVLDYTQICLAVVNDTNRPKDEVAARRWDNLKLQAMYDDNGMRLGDLLDVIKHKVEPGIGTIKDIMEESRVRASLPGRDSKAIEEALQRLIATSKDERVKAMASFQLYAASAPSAADRKELYTDLHVSREGNKLKFPAEDKDQKDWCKKYVDHLTEQLKKPVIGTDRELLGHLKLRSLMRLSELSEPNSNVQLEKDINLALLSCFAKQNPAIAREVMPYMIKRFAQFEKDFDKLDPDLQKNVRACQEQLRKNTLLILESDPRDDDDRVAARRMEVERAKVALGQAKTETDKAACQQRLADAENAVDVAGSSMKELKVAVCKDLATLLKGSTEDQAYRAAQALTAIAVPGDRSPLYAHQYPSLRGAAVEGLASLGNRQSVKAIAGLLADDPSPRVRMSALDALVTLHPEDLQQICLKRLRLENHPEIAKRLREVEFAIRRPDPNSKDFIDKFNKSKSDLLEQSHRWLGDHQAYLKGNDDLKYLDGDTLLRRVLNDLQDDYFKGLGGFLKFAWNGNEGVDQKNRELLGKYVNIMREQFDTLEKKAKTDDQALKALVSIALSNGKPFLKDDRAWATDRACEALKNLCVAGGPDSAKRMSWAMEWCLLNQPTLSVKSRRDLFDGFKALIPENSAKDPEGLTSEQAAVAVATTLQRMLRQTPKADEADYAEHQKLQLDLVDFLSKPRFQTRTVIPVLEAMMSVGRPELKFDGTKFTNGKGETIAADQVSMRDVENRQLKVLNGKLVTVDGGKEVPADKLMLRQFNHSMPKVRESAGDVLSRLRDGTALIAMHATVPKDATPESMAARLLTLLSDKDADADAVAAAVAAAGKLGPIKDRKDPRIDAFTAAANDGHERVRLMAAQELIKSALPEQREIGYELIAYSSLRGSNTGLVADAKRIIAAVDAGGGVLGDKEMLKKALDRVEKTPPREIKMSRIHPELTSDSLDYQDAFEAAKMQLKNASRQRNLARYQGVDNWFKDQESYQLIDQDVCRKAQGDAAGKAFPGGVISWLCTSRETIDKNCDRAVKDVWKRQEQQLESLCSTGARNGEAGKTEREAMASLLLSLGDPFRDGDRAWAVLKVSNSIYDMCKNGYQGCGDVAWLLQAALIEEPMLPPASRKTLFYAMTHLVAKGGMDKKDAAIITASALETEYQTMPPKGAGEVKGWDYEKSIKLQMEMLDTLIDYGNPQAAGMIKAMALHHPDERMRTKAAAASEVLVDGVLSVRFETKPDVATARADHAKRIYDAVYPETGKIKPGEDEVMRTIYSAMPAGEGKNFGKDDPVASKLRGIAGTRTGWGHPNLRYRLAASVALLQAGGEEVDFKIAFSSVAYVAQHGGDRPGVQKEAQVLLDSIRNRFKDKPELSKQFDAMIAEAKAAPPPKKK